MPELALATGSLEAPSGVSYLRADIEARASSVPTRSPSISAPSSFDGAASPWRAVLGQNSPRNMSPTANRKPEPINDPVTYTPTTHRVSKAKKGKKVHVCEFGCGKVFTRAEHRKLVSLASLAIRILIEQTSRSQSSERPFIQVLSSRMREALPACGPSQPASRATVSGSEKTKDRANSPLRHNMVNPNPMGGSPQRRASTTASGSGIQPPLQLAGVNQQLQQMPAPSLANFPQVEALQSQYAYPPHSQMSQSAMSGPVLSHSMASSYGYSNPSGSQTQFCSSEMGHDRGATQNPYWGYQSSMLYASPTDTMPSTESAGVPNYLRYRAEFAGIDKSSAAPSPVGRYCAPGEISLMC